MTNTNSEVSKTAEVLKNLSARDFLTLGIHDVAYIKPVKVESRMAYAIHAADGTPLSVMTDMSAALALIINNELEPVTVH